MTRHIILAILMAFATVISSYSITPEKADADVKEAIEAAGGTRSAAEKLLRETIQEKNELIRGMNGNPINDGANKAVIEQIYNPLIDACKRAIAKMDKDSRPTGETPRQESTDPALPLIDAREAKQSALNYAMSVNGAVAHAADSYSVSDAIEDARGYANRPISRSVTTSRLDPASISSSKVASIFTSVGQWPHAEPESKESNVPLLSLTLSEIQEDTIPSLPRILDKWPGAYHNALYANLVYEREDTLNTMGPIRLLMQFPERDREALKEIAICLSKINDNHNKADGFFANLYYNATTDQYHLSFRGTELILNDTKGDMQTDDIEENPISTIYKGAELAVEINSLPLSMADIIIKGKATDLMADAVTDIDANLLGKPTPQLDKTVELAAAINRLPVHIKKRLHLSGHSLGGGLSSLCGALTGIPTDTFNSMGINQRLLDHYTNIYCRRIGVPFDNKAKEETNRNIALNIRAFRTSKDVLSSLQDWGRHWMKPVAGALGKVIDIGHTPDGMLGIKDHYMDNFFTIDGGYGTNNTQAQPEK